MRQSEKKSKRTYCSELFAKYKSNIKSTWKSLIEVIGNTKNKWKDLPEKPVTNNAKVVKKQEIANLTSEIPNEQGGFEKYLENCNTVMNDGLVVDELRDTFFP